MTNRSSDIIKQPLVSLPPKIEAYEVKLKRAKSDITSFLKIDITGNSEMNSLWLSSFPVRFGIVRYRR